MKLNNTIAAASDNIDNYNLVASTDLTSINEVEHTHKKNIPKIQRELTLHVMMTNIKWDYTKCETTNVLRGEVSLNERGVLREFEIERPQGEGEECVVAERLWGVIEGV